MSVKSRIRKLVLAVVKPFPPLRRLARNTLVRIRKRTYRKHQEGTEVEPKTIVFESFMGRSYSDSPRALYEFMLSDTRFDDFTFIWAFRESKLLNEELAARYPELSRAELVACGSSEYRDAYARSSIWLSNSRLPEHLLPREGQRYLQTWHGTPLKRLTYDIDVRGTNALNSKRELFERNDADASRYHAMISPSPFVTTIYQSAFNLSALGKKDIIWEIGYPRNDKLINHKDDAAQCARIKANLGIVGEKKVVLYAPTWREDKHKVGVGYTHANQLDFEALRREFSDEYVFLFRAHYFVASVFDFEAYEGFVLDVSRIDDISDLYLVSDVLITDYSSVFFDFALLDRPVVFYMYDLDEYRDETRGFYLALDELPGSKCRTTSEVIEELLDSDAWAKRYCTERAQLQEKFCPLDDGMASKRAADRIIALCKGSSLHQGKGASNG